MRMVAALVSGLITATPFSGSAIIDRIDALRASLGVPADVVENPAWSRRCAEHNAWMSLNGEVAHEEVPGTPGYTPGGAWAGMNSVIAGGASWREGNPFANAPIHLLQLLDPYLREAGASDAYGASCVTTWPGVEAGAGRVWTVPRRGGRVVARQRALEGPYTPQERVGVRAGAVTGPYLSIWSSFRRLVSGSLVGPSGPVAVKVIDDRDVEGMAGPGNGWLLPVRPLKPLTTYRATVVLAGGRRRLTYSWTFTTKRA